MNGRQYSCLLLLLSGVLFLDSNAHALDFLNRKLSRQTFVASALLPWISFGSDDAYFYSKRARSSQTGDIESSSNVPNETQQSFPALPKDIEFSLRFLPKSGCWAVRTTVTRILGPLDREEQYIDGDEEDFSYFAIVDTASPFLTSPTTRAMHLTRISQFGATDEQYGEVVGSMDWRKADIMTWIGTSGEIMDIPNFIVGSPSADVIDETGGIFLGLIERDDNRPTFLQQVGGYPFFQISFDKSSPRLCLSTSRYISKDDPQALALFDLSPYGKDLYHYSIACEELQLLDAVSKKMKTLQSSDLSRPVVLVLDTGLTGCVMSLSLQEELGIPLNTSTVSQLAAIVSTVSGSKIRITATGREYWRLSSFKLPWFDNEQIHPHVIAIGSSVWANGEISYLAVDNASRMAKIG